MKKKMKKGLSLLLALVMVLGLMPNLGPDAGAAMVSGISLNISASGQYTLTLNDVATTGTVNYAYAVVPAFSTNKGGSVLDGINSKEITGGNTIPGAMETTLNGFLGDVAGYYDIVGSTAGTFQKPQDTSLSKQVANLTYSALNEHFKDTPLYAAGADTPMDQSQGYPFVALVRFGNDQMLLHVSSVFTVAQGQPAAQLSSNPTSLTIYRVMDPETAEFVGGFQGNEFVLTNRDGAKEATILGIDIGELANYATISGLSEGDRITAGGANAKQVTLEIAESNVTAGVSGEIKITYSDGAGGTPTLTIPVYLAPGAVLTADPVVVYLEDNYAEQTIDVALQNRDATATIYLVHPDYAPNFVGDNTMGLSNDLGGKLTVQQAKYDMDADGNLDPEVEGSGISADTTSTGNIQFALAAGLSVQAIPYSSSFALCYMDGNGATTFITIPITIYVNEAPPAVTYNVTYHANKPAGAGDVANMPSPNPASVNSGSNYTVSSTVPTLAGYEFSGWNTAGGGTGTGYASGDTIDNVTSNIELYAQWTEITLPTITPTAATYDKNVASANHANKVFTVSYGSYTDSPTLTIEKQGGGSSQDISSKLAGGTLTLDTTFLESLDNGAWVITATGSHGGTPKTATATLTVQDTTPVTYTVTYNANGKTLTSNGGNPPTASQVEADESFTLPTGVTANGYRFLGWGKTNDATGENILTGSTTVNTLTGSTPGPVTLYAIWEAVKPTFTDTTLANVAYNAASYSDAVAATPGSTGATVTYGKGAQFPDWLELDTATGAITLKNPGATGTVPNGPYTFNVTATDGINGATETASVTLTVIKAGQAAVTLTHVSDVLTTGGSEGSFSINDYSAGNSYEYSTNGTDYIAGLPGSNANGTITDLTAGTYYVRLAGDDNHNPGAAGSVEIKAPDKGFVEITLTKNGPAAAYSGQTVTLDSAAGTAIPEDGNSGVYKLSAVTTGDHDIYVDGTKVGKVTVNAGATAKATYAYFTITISAGTNGSLAQNVTASGTYLAGTSVNIGATANAGYTLASWKLEDGHTGTFTAPAAGATSFTAPDANDVGAVTLTAQYNPIPITWTNAPANQTATYGTAFSYQLPEAAGGLGLSYAVTNLPAGLRYDAATRTITGAVGNKPTAVTNGAVTVTATVSATNGADPVEKTFTITVNPAPVTFSIADKGGEHLAGQQTSDAVNVTFRAPYFNNSAWVEVTDTSASTISGINYAPSALSAGTNSYSATITGFAATYSDVWALPNAASINITVAAAYDVKVQYWKDNSLMVGDSATQVKLTKAGDVTTVIAGPTALTSGEVTFTSIPDGAGYDVYFGSDKVGTVAVNGGNATARIDYYTFSLAVDANGVKGASATEDGVYLKGAALNTTVTAKNGYHFDKWTDTTADGSTISAVPATLMAETHLYANFAATVPTATTPQDVTATYGTQLDSFAVTTISTAGTSPADTYTYGAITGAVPAGLALTRNPDGAITIAGKPETVPAAPVTISFTATSDLNGATVDVSFTITVNKYQPVLEIAAATGTFYKGEDAKNTVTITSFTAPKLISTGNWGVYMKDDLASVGTLTYAPETLDVGANNVTVAIAAGGYKTDGGLNLNDVFAPVTSSAVSVTGNASYDVTVNVTLDDGDYAAMHGKTVLLTNDGDPAITRQGALGNDGKVVIANVPNGSGGVYSILLDGTDTGKNVTVSNAAVTADLKYYNFSLTVGEHGSANGDATTNGIYIEGTALATGVTPATAYVLDQWTNNGSDIAASDVPATLTARTILKASFKPRAITYTGGAITLTAGAAAPAGASLGGASTDTDATGDDFTYAVTTGALPADLELGTNGALTGTANTVNTSGTTVTVTATDRITGVTKTANWTIQVNPAAFTVGITGANAQWGTELTATVATASDSDVTYQWYRGSVAEGNKIGDGSKGYTPVVADIGSSLIVVATGKDGTIYATGTAQGTYGPIVKKSPAAPALDKSDATTLGGSEGSITITNYDSDATYQIKKGNGSWEDATVTNGGVIENLAAGSYEIRVKETAGYNASTGTSATVADGTAYSGSVTIKVDDATTYTDEITSAKLVAGGGTTVNLNKGNNGVWATDSNALDTTKGDYTLYVTTNLKEFATAVTVNSTSQTGGEANFYTVKFDATATLSHVDAAWSGTLNTPPAVTAALTTGNDAITSGKVVLGGAGVTFSVGVWTEDYALTWDNGIATSNTTQGQLNVEAPITDPVTATLKQRARTVSGTVDKTTKGGDWNHVDAITFTTGGHSVNATYTPADGAFTAKLPAGFTYTVEAAIKAANQADTVVDHYEVGSSNPSNTITVAASDSNENVKVVLDGAKYTFKLTHGEAEVVTGKTWDAVTYGYADRPASQTVTIVNTGNRPLENVTITPSGAGTGAFDLGTVSAATIPVGGSATFTVQPKLGQDAKTYNATYTVSADRVANGDKKTYAAAITVNKAQITAAAITGIDAPVYPDALDGDFVVTPAVSANPGYTAGILTWSPTTDPAAAGTVYTATVVLTADGNHVFAAGTYTINGADDTDSSATVTVANDGATVTFTYTFPKTAEAAPTGLTVTADATGYNAGKFSADATGSNVVYYYVVSKTAQTLTGDQIKGATVSGDIVAAGSKSSGAYSDEAIPSLESNHTYHVYVAARAESGGNTSEWVLGSASFTTWYQLHVTVQGTSTTTKAHTATVGYGGANTTAAIGGTDTVTIGVKQGETVNLSAAKASGANGWAFKAWSSDVNDDTALTNHAAASNSYRPAGDGVTLTATFHKVISGTAGLSKTLSVAVGDKLTPTSAGYNTVTIGDTVLADFTTNPPDGLGYQWQYSTDDGANWADVTGATSVSWTVTAGTAADPALYVGAKFRVVITYSGDPALDNSTSKTNSLPTAPASAVLSNPTTITVKTVERADPGTTSLTPAELAKGGVYVTFNASAQDSGSSDSNPVEKYIVSVYKGTGTNAVVSKEIPAGGAASYAWPFPASDNLPPTYGGQTDQYAVKITTIAKADAKYVSASASDLSAAADAGRVVLDKSLLTSTALGSGSMANNTAVFTSVTYDGTPHSLAISTSSTEKTGAVTVYYAAGDTTAPTNVGSYTISVSTGEGSYYLPEPEFGVGTWQITAATISAVAVNGLTAPSVNTAPVATADVPESAGYVDETTGSAGSGKATITWKDSAGAAVTGNFKAGETYTAEVTYKPDANHAFAATVSGSSDAANTTVDASVAGGKVTVKVTFAPLPAGTPEGKAQATSFDAGKLTELSVDSAAAATFYYKLRLSSAAAATVNDLKSGGTTLTGDAGTIASGKSTWQGAVNFGDRAPNTEYAIDVLTKVGNTWGDQVSTITFTTPYKVTVTTDNHGTVAVGSAPASSGSQDFAVYASGGGKDGIADSLSMATDGSDGYLFKDWSVTPAADSGSVSGAGNPYTYSPEGTAGVITLKANFQAYYTVEYDFNAGSSTVTTTVGGSTPATAPTDATKYTAGSVTLDGASSFYRAGFTFKGWYQTADYNANFSAPGGAITLEALINANRGGDGSAPAPGSALKLYAMWESEDFTFTGGAMPAAKYNMAAGDYNGGNPVTGIVAQGGSGTYKYKMERTPVPGDLYPDFLQVDENTGAISLQNGKRMGAVGSYRFQVTVTDTATSLHKSAYVTLAVEKSTPNIVSLQYHYDGNLGYGFNGDTVVYGPGAVTAVVQDPYDANVILTTLGEWDTAPAAFNGAAGTAEAPQTESYTFTFEVTDDGAKGNYTTATQSQELKAIKRDPDIQVSIDTVTFGKNVTNRAAKTYGYGVETVTVTVKNTGNTKFTGGAISSSDASVDPSVEAFGTLDVGNTVNFTFDVPIGKTVADSGYRVVFTVTGQTDTATATATYTYDLTVNPAVIPGAAIQNITEPSAGTTATTTLSNGADGSDHINSGTDAKSDLTGGFIYEGKTAWTGTLDGGKFQAGAGYTATVTLTADANHVFGPVGADNYKINSNNATDPLNPSVNPTAVVVNSGKNVVITWKFPALSPANPNHEAEAKSYQSGAVTKLEADSAVPVTFYYTVSTKSDETPTPQQVLAAAGGANDGFAGAIKGRGTQPGGEVAGGKSTWTGSAPISGLEPNTTYHIYMTSRATGDSSGELSVVKKISFTTPWKLIATAIASSGGANPAGNKITNTDVLGSNGVAAGSSQVVSLPGEKTFTAVTADGWVVKDWTLSDISQNNDNSSYTLTPAAGGGTYELGAIFRKVITGKPVVLGTVGEGNTLTAGVNADNVNQLAVGGDKISDLSATSYPLTYQWAYSINGNDWYAIAGANQSTFQIPVGDSTYAGAQFSVNITYTGDPALNGDNSSVISDGTDGMSIQLAKPGVTVTPSGSGGGGLVIQITKSADDDKNTGSNLVKEYVVTITDGAGTTINKTVPADGSNPGAITLPAGTDGITPGTEYTVTVVAKPQDSDTTHTDSEAATGSAKAAKVTLKLGDLTIAWTDTTFNGRVQTAGTVTGPTAPDCGAIHVYYSNQAGDTGGKVRAGTYNMYVSVEESDYYTALPMAAAGTWTISQATAGIQNPVTSVTATQSTAYDLTAINNVIRYTVGAGDGAAEYNNGLVTGYYDFVYTVKTLPDGYTGAVNVSDVIADPANFVPDALGDWGIEVRAAYSNTTATTAYRADVGEPAQVNLTVTVTDRVVTGITIEKGSAINAVTYGNGVARNPDPDSYGYYDATDAANAKSMRLDGLKITVTYSAGDPVVYIVGRDTLPAGMELLTSDEANTTVSGSALDFDNNTVASTEVKVKFSGETSESFVTYTMSARKLDYTTVSASGTKVYDGTAAVTDGSLSVADGGVLAGDTVSLTATGYTLDNGNVGTGKPITASGVAVGGAQGGFYAVGTQTKGTMDVTAAATGAIKIKDVDAPKTGGTPDTSAVIDPAVTAPHYTIVGAVTWDKTLDNGKFREGETYTATVTVKPDANYAFTSAQIDAATFNGETPTSAVPNGDGTVTLTYTFPKTKIAKVDVIVDAPAKGVMPDTPEAGSDKFTVKDDWTWTKTTDGAAHDKTKVFEADTAYTLTVTVVPAPGEAFADQLAPTVNGKMPASVTPNGDGTYTITYDFPKTEANTPDPGPGPGPGPASKSLTVTYDIDKAMGSTEDKTTESVESGAKPAAVPEVKVNDGYAFLGWTLDPKAEKVTLVKPGDQTITENTTFYAVFAKVEDHQHYIIGYPNGNFGPEDNITRASVATIIARACLDDFVEGSDYGNPGSYSDVAGHWAESAIAFCSNAGVFIGYEDGTFRPDQPITRQEFALVIARLDGVKKIEGELPFEDAADVPGWALDGVYTTVENGWVNGYTDGTFKPLKDIRRDEAVKIFNMYLRRGVNAAGLVDVTGDYKTWPDVPTSQWAYEHIIEASNDHKYYFVDGVQPPEHWTQSWVEPIWGTGIKG